jgi:hypothetical protein
MKARHLINILEAADPESAATKFGETYKRKED